MDLYDGILECRMLFVNAIRLEAASALRKQSDYSSRFLAFKLG
jgi:hypothetical protein